MKDYRVSHLGKRKSTQYEDIIYSAGSYDDILWEEEKKVLDREYMLLKKVTKDIDYLDFACGTGRILTYLEDRTEHSVGVDISSSMLAKARGKTRRSELLEADLTVKDDLLGNMFDCITAFRFFLNAQDDMRHDALRILSAKLKDEHSIFIFNIHGNILSHRFLTKLWYLLRGRMLNAMSYWEVRKLAAQHGLRIVRYYGFGIIPKFFYRVLRSSMLLPLDRFLSRIPGARYVSYNMIFVCVRQ